MANTSYNTKDTKKCYLLLTHSLPAHRYDVPLRMRGDVLFNAAIVIYVVCVDSIVMLSEKFIDTSRVLGTYFGSVIFIL